MPVLLEIISPEKVVFSASVDMAVIPGEEGDIAAMPDRAPMMLSLRGGVLSYYEGERVAGTYFVAGGFADLTAEKCTVLADKAFPVSEISTRDAHTALEGLEAALANVTAEDVVEQDRIARRIQIARAEIEAAEESFPTHAHEHVES